MKFTMSRKGSVPSRCEDVRVLVGLEWLADYLVEALVCALQGPSQTPPPAYYIS
jgi:hypothetical protein